MKKLEELTNEVCQKFLDLSNSGKKFLKLELNENEKGIMYQMDEKIDLIPFYNFDLINWLYENEYDITLPLKELEYEYVELDETNSILFEYAMGVNMALYKEPLEEIDSGYNNVNIGIDTSRLSSSNKIIEKIKKLQQELIEKI